MIQKAIHADLVIATYASHFEVTGGRNRQLFSENNHKDIFSFLIYQYIKWQGSKIHTTKSEKYPLKLFGSVVDTQV
jgi:hypothetical protein